MVEIIPKLISTVHIRIVEDQRNRKLDKMLQRYEDQLNQHYDLKVYWLTKFEQTLDAKQACIKSDVRYSRYQKWRLNDAEFCRAINRIIIAARDKRPEPKPSKHLNYLRPVCPWEIERALNIEGINGLRGASKREQQEEFVAVFKRCLDLNISCHRAGINRKTFYKWKIDDADFAEKFNDIIRDWTLLITRAMASRMVGHIMTDPETGLPVKDHYGNPCRDGVNLDLLKFVADRVQWARVTGFGIPIIVTFTKGIGYHLPEYDREIFEEDNNIPSIHAGLTTMKLRPTSEIREKWERLFGLSASNASENPADRPDNESTDHLNDESDANGSDDGCIRSAFEDTMRMVQESAQKISD